MPVRHGRTAQRMSRRMSGGRTTREVWVMAVASLPLETASLLGGGWVDRTKVAEEDGRGWRPMTRFQMRCGGGRVRTRRNEGRGAQSGNRDSAVILREKITGDGYGANEAPRQHAWCNEGNNRATALPQAAARVAHGGKGGNVRGGNKGGSTSTRITVAPTAMVLAASLPGAGE